ncbi:MAG: UDP-N-acetylglucosamine 1-carboxyvinyltransferase [Alcanivoracaceae bacterium]|nr:UDP-N-acetylglucosamine 1-carboxyvinyltransferase [Alcanivoracaceae bacterium]
MLYKYNLAVIGGKPLCGEVTISGSKNASFPILAASLLVDGTVTLQNIPKVQDIINMLTLFGSMGSKISHVDGNIVEINNADISIDNMQYDLIGSMRGSILILGALLHRFPEFQLTLPGGCNIGKRPIDFHLDGFRAMGVNITQQGDVIKFSRSAKLSSAKIELEYPSVCATENFMLAGSLAEGTTTIINAACEPEVVELANFLRSMGAKITGEGTDTINVTGVKQLHATEYKIMPDRIETGTYLAAAAITRGKITLKNVDYPSVFEIASQLIAMGVDITQQADDIVIDASAKLQAFDLVTGPHPEFPTDMQPQFCALNSVALGESKIIETVFENRLQHIPELNKMGANLERTNNEVYSSGGNILTAAEVEATDLRAAAALLLAGLAAKGETIIKNAHYLSRGYESVFSKLSNLGATLRYL